MGNWLARIPLWAKVAVPSVIVAVILCNVIGRPKNPHNYQVDTLATTREAYKADTLRLLALADSLKQVEARERAAKEVERAKWIEAEQRAAAARVMASGARQILARAQNVRDSLDAAMELIAAQERVIAAQDTALSSARAAFGRLTAEHHATLARADSLEAGWRRTRERLALSESALATEQKRTTCTWNVVLKRVECPSRGTIAVVAAVGAVLAYSQFQKRN
jgi:hypothetical protein